MPEVDLVRVEGERSPARGLSPRPSKKNNVTHTDKLALEHDE